MRGNGGEEREWGRKNRARARGSSKTSEARGKRERGIVGERACGRAVQQRERSEAAVWGRGRT